MKTFDQYKDEVAINNGFKSWKKIDWYQEVELYRQAAERQAAELYTQEVAKEFANYLKDNRWRLSIETGEWERTFSHSAPEIKTSEEVYALFLTTLST